MKRSYLIAVVIALAAVGWVASGQFTRSTAEAPATPEPRAEQARVVPSVRVARLTAQPMVSEIIVQGLTESERQVNLRAEIRGRVEDVLVARGAPVKAGEPILRIAVNERAAELERARALLAQRRVEYEAARQLGERGVSSEIRVAEARAKFDEARAEVTGAELALAKTTVTAPFDGILNERTVHVGDWVDAGTSIGNIVDLDPIRIIGRVSERHIAAVQPGAIGHARLLDSRLVEGRITYVAATADPATRTFRVELSVPNPDGRIADGLTTELRVPVREQIAHRVSPAVLTLNDEGQIGVKMLTEDNRVRFVPVQILKDEPDGIWLGGLPDEATLIVVGQEFVTPNEKVEPVFVAGGA